MLTINLPKCLFLFILFNMATVAHGRIPDFETSQLKSNAGSGVGALLIDEATLLNPAPLAFFNIGSIYVQKTNIRITRPPETPPPTLTPPKSELTGVILSDSTSRTVKGSLSYTKTVQEFEIRERFSASFAFLLSKRSAAGVVYRLTKEKPTKKFKQVILGLSHLLSKNFSLGFIVIDPFKTKPQDTRAFVGGQYNFENFVFFLLDLGSDYNDSLSKSIVFKTALKIRLFQDLFLAFGLYQDKAWSERGNGIGLSWVGPRLTFDLSFKNRTLLENTRLNQERQDIRENSLSLSYRF